MRYILASCHSDDFLGIVGICHLGKLEIIRVIIDKKMGCFKKPIFVSVSIYCKVSSADITYDLPRIIWVDFGSCAHSLIGA